MLHRWCSARLTSNWTSTQSNCRTCVCNLRAYTELVCMAARIDGYASQVVFAYHCSGSSHRRLVLSANTSLCERVARDTGRKMSRFFAAQVCGERLVGDKQFGASRWHAQHTQRGASIHLFFMCGNLVVMEATTSITLKFLSSPDCIVPVYSSHRPCAGSVGYGPEGVDGGNRVASR
jgi:hypothetical protein